MKIDLPAHVADKLRHLAPPGIEPERLAVGLLASKIAKVYFKRHVPNLARSEGKCPRCGHDHDLHTRYVPPLNFGPFEPRQRPPLCGGCPEGLCTNLGGERRG